MPPDILGLAMMPYSLGCELQLYRQDSPFLAMDTVAFEKLTHPEQLLALHRGLMICCKTKPDDESIWQKHNMPKTAEKLKAATKAFHRYIMDGRLQFRFELARHDGVSTRYLGEPEICRLYRWVIRNMPREEIALYGQSAWDFPFSLAKMLSQGEAEDRGEIEIYNVEKKSHDEYHLMSESARAAWGSSKTDDERKDVLKKFPVLRDMLDIKDEIEKMEKGAN